MTATARRRRRSRIAIRARFSSGSVVFFYDMTSLYFEAEDENDLRRIGFSKDGKFQNPRIMLGLLVGENGFPVGYDIFEGNTFEDRTLLPDLQRIQEKYRFGKPVVVADAAMLSQDNLDTLDREKYPFVVAARLRNETEAMRKTILQRCHGRSNGQSVVIEQDGGRRPIVAYSDKRARKDQHNRAQGLQRLKKRVASGRLIKEHLNNRGDNKFPKLTGEATVEIDEAKGDQAMQWEGLKGHLTNTRLPAESVIESYGQLWHIEKAFRISKTDLRIRPMYHRRRRPIEAYVRVAFVAYAICKELERRLKEAGVPISPKRAAELTQTMCEIGFQWPADPHEHRTLPRTDDDPRRLYDLLY